MTTSLPPMAFASHYRWLVLGHLIDWSCLAAPLVDVGCDDGGFVARLPHRPAIAIDRAYPRGWGMDVLRLAADATALPLATGSAASVLAVDVLEHVRDDAAVARELTRILRPGGSLLLSTPHEGYRIGPAYVMRRAETAWGHLRSGYRPDSLVGLFTGLRCRVTLWPTPWFSRLYLVMWGLRRLSATAARRLAHWCFLLDSRRPPSEGGWLVLEGAKP